jgi:putative tryptophan/tyrosine transport system substrate-binding protein
MLVSPGMRITRLSLLHSLLAFALYTCSTGLASASEVVVLKSSHVAYYTQAVAGFRAQLPADVHIREYTLPESTTESREIGQSIRAGHPDLVYTVGLKAALLAKDEIPDIRVVFSHVLNPEQYGLPTGNMTGILMKIPLGQQLQAIKSLAPQARRIGVLYAGQQPPPAIQAAAQQGKPLGLRLIAMDVTASGTLAEALKTLLPQIDVLWLLPDHTVITEESVSLLLRATVDSRVPMFGFSKTLVQRGGLGALIIDPVEAGRQAGGTAMSLLGHSSTAGKGLVSPEHPRLVLNLSTAEYLGLTPAPEVIRMASQLFGGSGPFALQHDHKDMAPVP